MYRPRIYFPTFNGNIPTVPPVLSESAGGWADYGIATTGAGDIAYSPYDDFEEMWDDFKNVTPLSTPKNYLYTGPDVLLDEQAYRAIGLQNKTITASSGQLLERGCIQMDSWNNVIFRNFRRKNILSPSYENDAFRILGSTHIWLDHCDIDGEATASGTGKIGDGGIDISGESDLITISNTKLQRMEKTSLIVSDNSLIANRGKGRVTYRNCEWKNNHIRQPFVRFGWVHLLNCFFHYDPIFTRAFYQYGGARLAECGFESQIFSEHNYYAPHRYGFKDQDNNVGAISGIKSVGDFWEETELENLTSWGSSLREIRPENVSFDPRVLSGYNYALDLMSPAEARLYALQWAGAKYHIKNPIAA